MHRTGIYNAVFEKIILATEQFLCIRQKINSNLCAKDGGIYDTSSNF